jgi:uncharacterized membrane protein
MYLFDPQRGRARRSKVGNQLTHYRRKLRERTQSARSDAEHRIHGVVERVRHPPAEGVDDRVIEARVRARLGRFVSHSSAINVVADDHGVTLSGPILEHEADRLVHETRMVAGVREVIDSLERHVTADVPALQGGGEPRPNRTLWPPSVQGAAMLAGAGLALWGVVRGGLTGGLGMIGGSVLALRAGLNRPVQELGRMLLGRDGIEIAKTIHVNAPVENVFDLWNRFENFPRFLEHVREIRIDERDPMRSHWIVEGPAGRSLEFDAVTTHVTPLREIGWTTTPDQPIEHTGIVRFAKDHDGTRVQVHLTYRPPGGMVGHAVARLLGWDPKARIDDDLVRMKGLLEEGRTRAHGDRVWMQDLTR